MKSYKTLIFVALLVVIGNTAFSQINGINYQAVAVDEQGKEIAGMDLRGNIIHNKAINVRFSILLGSSTGTILYQETHSTNTDPHGLFTLVIGQGVTTSQGTVNSIVDIDWSTQNHYLKVEIDFKQSGGYKLMGIQQLLAVPYSYYALKSGNPPQELTLTGNELSISNGNTITLPSGSYTAGEGINITGNTITNTAPNQLQVLSISNDTIFLTNGGFVKLPPIGSNISYTDLLNKPTNLSQFINDVGFIANESDPNFQASAAFGISLTNIANWNSSFSWGNHVGLYKTISYVPDWSEITGKPILFDGTWASLLGKPVLATVSTSGSYNDLLNKPALFSGSYSDLTNKPVLFDGTWSSLSGKPTTIAEYGITDAFNGDYNNLFNKPLLFSGSYTDLSNKPSLFSGNFSDLTGKPTTLLGYGITDAMSTSHSAYGITSADITNWTVAYNWGDHSGLYKPISYVPDWTEITGKPAIEPQTLSISNDTIYLSSGGYVVLPNSPDTSLSNSTFRIGFDASGNWVCPEGVTEITVQLWGGSGGGGGGDWIVVNGPESFGCVLSSTTTKGGNGGNGGNGGYLKQTYNVIPGRAYSIIIGNAGIGGIAGTGTWIRSSNPTNGTNGGQSSFDGTIVANGGSGGKAGISIKGGCGNGIAGNNGEITNYNDVSVTFPSTSSSRNYIPVGYTTVTLSPSPSATGGTGGSGALMYSGYTGYKDGNPGNSGTAGYCIISYKITH